MKDTKKEGHTPGPWREGNLVGDTRAILDANGCYLAFAALDANARLIAAAPDLLEALKKIELWGCDPSTHERDLRPCRTCVARAALAKAEGRSGQQDLCVCGRCGGNIYECYGCPLES